MVAVFLLVAFSVPASAETRSDIRLTYRVYGNNKTTLNLDNDDLIGNYQSFIYSNSGQSHSFGGVQNYSYLHQFIILQQEDDSVLFEKDKYYSFKFSGIKNTCIDKMDFMNFAVRLYYSDGTVTSFMHIEGIDIKSDNFIHTVSFNVNSDKDITRMYFWLKTPHVSGTNASIGLQTPVVDIEKLSTIEGLITKFFSNAKNFFNSMIEFVSENGGLFSTIKTLIQDSFVALFNDLYEIRCYLSDNRGVISTIKTFIQNGFNSLLFDLSEVRDNVLDIFNTIKEIPGKILDIPNNLWSSFKQGIYEWLFPDDIVSTFGSRFDVSSYGLFFMPFGDFSDLYFDFIDNCLSLPRENFVLFFDIYELFYEFIDDFVFHFEFLEPESSFEIPKIEIPLSEGSFIFGPYTVNVVPEKFVFLCEYCRLFTSSVATLSFLFYMFLRVKEVFVR